MVFTETEYRGIIIMIGRMLEKGLIQPDELVPVGNMYKKAEQEVERLSQTVAEEKPDTSTNDED